LLLLLGLLVGTLAQAQSGAVAFMAPVAEVVSNPYGLRSVWAQGDWVARATLLLLAFMSLLSWYFIIAKWLSQRQLQAQLQAANSAFTRDETLQLRSEAMDTQSPFCSILMSALAARRRHASLAGQVDLGNWLSQDIVHSVSSLQMRSQEGLSILATVGSTAPFVGLFGTVWGIYNALVKIGMSGQASIDKVAGPVGESLIMTAIGLAVAVPAVLGYNWLVRRNKGVMEDVHAFGSDLHSVLLASSKK
jgi:biopolymer transport protein ExbB